MDGRREARRTVPASSRAWHASVKQCTGSRGAHRDADVPRPGPGGRMAG
ncbi:hypothetical protein KPATCC21470_1121 [Kitasatospora purpeofusca]